MGWDLRKYRWDLRKYRWDWRKYRWDWVNFVFYMCRLILDIWADPLPEDIKFAKDVAIFNLLAEDHWLEKLNFNFLNYNSLILKIR